MSEGHNPWIMRKKAPVLMSRDELLEENKLLYGEVLAARDAASITADLVVEQFARIEKINRSLESVNQELKRKTNLDGLTGVFNRRFHDRMLGREWRRCRRSQYPLSLVMVDIDHFKLFNDHYGHLAGDHCLQQVARTLEGIVKRSSDALARYGGEEFVFILPENDIVGALHIAENARREVEKLEIPHKGSNVSPRVTISLGAASLVPAQGMGPSELIRRADQALYQAKEEGRNRSRMYGQGLKGNCRD
ncbi:MAG: diguanylate cyclase [Thermodesulfobacteriota bacterium]